jgi:hypothetical protein
MKRTKKLNGDDCRGLRKRSLQDRQKFLRENRICFKCCESKEHIAKNCTANIKCQICGNIRHATAMHMEKLNGGNDT